jgi:hypothetical protein
LKGSIRVQTKRRRTRLPPPLVIPLVSVATILALYLHPLKTKVLRVTGQRVLQSAFYELLF